MVRDHHFPLISYESGKTPQQWGQAHGEDFRSAIGELAQIRRQLMQGRNPKLTGPILEELANEQWEKTRSYDTEIFSELMGIQEGSGLSTTDLVILNNYTDFRDIQPEEGCSTVYVRTENGVICGQTWDMHSTAKNYVCTIRVPESNAFPAASFFSLVGCVGMTGFNRFGCMIGINNLNTMDAKPGVLWPALVRKALKGSNLEALRKTLLDTAVTSAHGYLIADAKEAEIWEITPTLQAKVSQVTKEGVGSIYHTNHCLDAGVQKIESPAAVATTTRDRYRLLQEKVPKVSDLDDLFGLLSNHDGYPKSICSHFESGAQDPSYTCGGAIGDLHSGTTKFWRGCEEHSQSTFKAHTLENL